jgi:UDP-glucose 4-epimerase
MDERHPTEPTTAYGASKLAGEAYARACATSGGCPTVIVRPFNCYGPRCHHEGTSGEVIPRFFLRALTGRPLVVFGDGRQTRDFTYVADTVRGLLLAADCDAAVGRTINIGSGQEVSVAELAKRIAVAAGRPETQAVFADPRPGDIARQCADTTTARDLLGFVPRVSIDEGLRHVYAWYASHPVPLSRLIEEEQLRSWEVEPVDRIAQSA